MLTFAKFFRRTVETGYCPYGCAKLPDQPGEKRTKADFSRRSSRKQEATS